MSAKAPRGWYIVPSRGGCDQGVSLQCPRSGCGLARGWAFQMACMPIDTHAYASEGRHVGAGMTSMLHADRAHAHAEHS